MAEKLVDVVQSVKQSGITNMNDIVEYLEGKGNSDRLKTGEVLTEALGENALERILNLKDAVRKYEED